MVYINSFNAFFTVIMIGLLSGFVIFTAYLWIGTLEEHASEGIGRTSYNMTRCNCLFLISEYNGNIVLYNECRYGLNFTLFVDGVQTAFSRVDEEGGVIKIYYNHSDNSSNIELYYNECLVS